MPSPRTPRPDRGRPDGGRSGGSRPAARRQDVAPDDKLADDKLADDKLDAVRARLADQRDAMRRAHSTLGRCAEGMEAVNRALDETDLTLKSATRRLNGAAALVARVERDGPVAALPDVIDQLRADMVDRSNSRFAEQYAEMLTRALDVQAEIGRR